MKKLTENKFNNLIRHPFHFNIEKGFIKINFWNYFDKIPKDELDGLAFRGGTVDYVVVSGNKKIAFVFINTQLNYSWIVISINSEANEIIGHIKMDLATPYDKVFSKDQIAFLDYTRCRKIFEYMKKNADNNRDQNVKFKWDFDSTNLIRIGHDINKRTKLAQTGSIVHKEFADRFVKSKKESRSSRLDKKMDFINNFGSGYSIERAIRDKNGKVVKVFDEKKRRKMMSKPDFVDYDRDLIIDLKSYYSKEFIPSDSKMKQYDGRELLLEEPLYNNIPQERPDEYVDVSFEIKCQIECFLYRKYYAQFKRYLKAYELSTGREARVEVYVTHIIKEYEYEGNISETGIKVLA